MKPFQDIIHWIVEMYYFESEVLLSLTCFLENENKVSLETEDSWGSTANI